MKIKRVVRYSETTLGFYFSDVVVDDLVVDIARFSEFVRNEWRDVIEVVPCSTSLFVEFSLLKNSVVEMERGIYDLLGKFLSEKRVDRARAKKLIELPVYYHPEVAQDLMMLAEAKEMSVDEVVRMHSEVEYSVASLGFAPGFAYLSGLNPELATPRMSAPKVVAKGSLGIAGEQTAVYPRESPGGWVIVGNCPVDLFDYGRDPITEFEVGARVRFSSVSRREFIAMGGLVGK